MHAVKHYIKHAHTASLSLRYRRWLIPAVFLLKWMLNCSVLTQSLMQKYIDNPDLFVHLLKMALCHPQWADPRINVILFRGKETYTANSLSAGHVSFMEGKLEKAQKKREEWWWVKEKWSQRRIKQGWNTTRTIRGASPARIRRREAFTHYSAQLTAGEGKQFYSFSNASVSVNELVWVYWAKNRVVIEK